MTEEICENCKFSEFGRLGARQCHARPPQIIGGPDDDYHIHSETLFPYVDSLDWCGEYKLREEAHGKCRESDT